MAYAIDMVAHIIENPFLKRLIKVYKDIQIDVLLIFVSSFDVALYVFQLPLTLQLRKRGTILQKSDEHLNSIILWAQEQ